MTSQLALTVEECAQLSRIASTRSKTSSGYHIELAMALNALIESKRQSYMSTDRARAQYDDDLKVST